MQPADTDIRADVCPDDAVRFAESIFGLKVLNCRQFPGYEDKNFHVHGYFENAPDLQSIIGNPRDPRDYVLKVANSYDSSAEKRHIIEAQNELMLFLLSRGLKVQRPLPVPNVDPSSKQHLSTVRLIKKHLKNPNGKHQEHVCDKHDDTQHAQYAQLDGAVRREHVIRLLTYVPGEVMLRILPAGFKVFYEAGKFLSKFHLAMREFDNDTLRFHSGLWNLEAVSTGLLDHVDVLDSEWKRSIVKSTIASFQAMEPKFSTFQRGWVHGDPNEQNLLIDVKTEEVCGLLDFQDTRFSYIIFDVALLICYTMFTDTSQSVQRLHQLPIYSKLSALKDALSSNSQPAPEGEFVGEQFPVDAAIVKLLVGGHVLAGYLSESTLNESELQCLPELIAARFAQSLTLGEFTYRRLESSNDYVLSTARTGGWQMLHAFHVVPAATIASIWQDIVTSYKSQV